MIVQALDVDSGTNRKPHSTQKCDWPTLNMRNRTFVQSLSRVFLNILSVPGIFMGFPLQTTKSDTFHNNSIRRVRLPVSPSLMARTSPCVSLPFLKITPVEYERADLTVVHMYCLRELYEHPIQHFVCLPPNSSENDVKLDHKEWCLIWTRWSLYVCMYVCMKILSIL